MATYEERDGQRRIAKGFMVAAGVGALAIWRKQAFAKVVEGAEWFINKEVGGIVAATEARQAEFRPAARLASEISSAINTVGSEVHQSLAAGYLLHHENAAAFREAFGTRSIREALGLGTERNVSKYQEALRSFISPTERKSTFESISKYPQFQNMVAARARVLGTDGMAQARQEIADALSDAHQFAERRAAQMARSHQRTLADLVQNEYILNASRRTFTDDILQFFGAERRTLKEDLSMERAADLLIHGTENRRGALLKGMSTSEAADYMKRLGDVRTGLLLKVGDKEADLSLLPTAISKWYNRQRPVWVLPTAPFLEGFGPFSFWPHLRGQSPNIVHRISSLAHPGMISDIVGESAEGMPGSLYVVGRRTGLFSFQGKGRLIGLPAVSQGEAVNLAAINDRLATTPLDVRDARAGFLRSVKSQMSRQAQERVHGPSGLHPAPESLAEQWFAGSNDPAAKAFVQADRLMRQRMQPGGPVNPSIWTELRSVVGKYRNPDYLPNIYKNRILQADSIDPEALQTVLGALKGRAGRIDPADIVHLMPTSAREMETFFTGSAPEIEALFTTQTRGQTRFLDDQEILKFFANPDLDLRSIRSQELKRAVLLFRRSPENALSYSHGGAGMSVADDLNLNLVAGISGRPTETRGVDYLRDSLVAELSQLGEFSDQNLITRVLQSGLNEDKKHRYAGFLYGHALSERLFEEDADAVYAAFRDPSNHSLRNVVEKFLQNRYPFHHSFSEGIEHQSNSRYLVMRASPSADLPSFKSWDSLKDYGQNVFSRIVGAGKHLVSDIYGGLSQMLAPGTRTERAAGFSQIHQTLRNSYAGRRARAFMYGMNDPEAMEAVDLAPYFYLHRLNSQFLEPLGIGLGQDELSSAGKIAWGLAAKRFLPAYLGIRAYDRLETFADDHDLPGPDEVQANLRARAGIRARRFGDKHGITSFLQRLQKLMPGSEEYLNFRPMSEDEYKAYLDHGRDPVRRSRGWLFGSRTPFRGTSVEYYEPNFYLRAHSDWETAPGGPRSKETYYNPLNPYAYEKSQSIGAFAPRPYPLTSPLVDPNFAFAGLINNTLGRILKPQRAINEALMRRVEKARASAQEKNPNYLVDDSVHGSDRLVSRQVEPSYTDSAPGSLIIVGAGGTMQPVAVPGLGVPAPYENRFWGRSLEGKSLSKRQMQRLNRKLYSMGTGFAKLAHPTRPTEGPIIDPRSLNNQLDMLAYHGQEMAGIYGFLSSFLPGQDYGRPAHQRILADASMASGSEARFWDANRGGTFLGVGGMTLDQPLNELVRRFLPHKRRTLETYNPLPNQFYGSEWLPNDNTYFLDFQTGDPYGKVKQGQMRLPGEAYRRIWRPEILTMRASSAGRSVEEMVASMLHQRSPLTSYGESVTTFGTKAHSQVEAALRRVGFSIANEVPVADAQLGLRGHIDAILKTGRGLEISDIKTVGDKKFQEVLRSGRGFEEHLRQLSVYEHITGIHQGRLFYVSRETGQVKDVSADYDPHRFGAVMESVEAARQIVLTKLKNRQVSEADLYDDVTRYEILSDVAPYSLERKALGRSLAHSDQLSREDKDRIQAAQKRASLMRKRVETFDYKYLGIGDRTAEKSFTVERVAGAQDLYLEGQDMPFRIAGGRLSAARMRDWLEGNWHRANGESLEESLEKHHLSVAEAFYQAHGIFPGAQIKGFVDTDPNWEIRNGTRRIALPELSQSMIQSGVMTESEDESPTGIRARFSEKEIRFGSIYERIAHADTPINTKFLPVRSPLEAYERSIVYGTSEGSWNEPFKTYVWPTISSMTHKHPLASALMGGFFASLPFRQRTDKLRAAGIGMLAGMALSFFGKAYDHIKGKPFIPTGLQRRREVEEYFDILKYVKERSLYEKKAALAEEEEGVDVKSVVARMEGISNYRKSRRREIDRELKSLRNSGDSQHMDALREERKRLSEPIAGLVLGPIATEAIEHRNAYRRTMYGARSDSPLMDVMASLPKGERDILMAGIKSPQADKDKLYRLLSDPEKRLLGRQLGQDPDELPDRPNLTKYFEDHYLPEPDSPVWDEEVPIEDLKVRAFAKEGFRRIELGIYPQVLARAEERTQGIAVPYPNGRSKRITENLNAVLSGQLQGQQIYTTLAYQSPKWQDEDSVKVDLAVRQDRRQDLWDHINQRY